MNKKRFFLRNVATIVACLAVLTLFSGCGKDKADDPKPITVANNGQLTQTVFADKTEGASGVNITTTGAWTSSIAETAATRASAPAWISISPESGDKAGQYNIVITLTPNTTRADRTAVITISCAGTEITITVTQKKEKEDGTTLEPMTQQQIIDLLNAAWSNTRSANEIAISGTNTGWPYSFRYEINRAQKKALSAEIKSDNSFNEFEYIDNLTKYVYHEPETKYRITLPATFWAGDTIMKDVMGEDGEFEYYTWTVEGNVYNGISQDGNTGTFELTADNKIKTMHVIDDDGEGYEDDDMTATFTYTNVNPAFPAGFNKADFPERLYGGTGTFTNTRAAGKQLTVYGARHGYYSLYFDTDGDRESSVLYFYIDFPGNADGVPLPAGTYHYNDYQTTSEYLFSCYEGDFGGVSYYGKGGTMTVSKSGDTYTITVDMDTYHEYYGNETTGKIQGTYTGYLLMGDY